MLGRGEDTLIARFFAPLAGPGSLDLLDDAALIPPRPGRELVVTADALVAGVHFFPDDPAASIGRKALAVNLSDLAAKGAEPAGFLLTIALPQDWTETWLQDFCRGLATTSHEHGCPLLGGDTVRTPGPLTISITAIGSVPEGRMVRRTTAHPGDAVCVTGTIGDAVLGLALSRPDQPGWRNALSDSDADWLIDRYRQPRPRCQLAPALRDCASAGMDVSDGFAGDLAKLLRVSGVGAEIDLDALPLSVAAQAALEADPGLLQALLTGGDDYEILCSVPPNRVADLVSAGQLCQVPIARLGQVGAEPGVGFSRSGKPYSLPALSFSHF